LSRITMIYSFFQLFEINVIIKPYKGEVAEWLKALDC
jgi:hypothetical protein